MARFRVTYRDNDGTVETKEVECDTVLMNMEAGG